MNKILIIVAVVIVLGGGYWVWQNQAPAAGPAEPAVSLPATDLAQGWYYGEVDQKKQGTPDTWKHRGAGTRSAQWYDPAR